MSKLFNWFHTNLNWNSSTLYNLTKNMYGVIPKRKLFLCNYFFVVKKYPWTTKKCVPHNVNDFCVWIFIFKLNFLMDIILLQIDYHKMRGFTKMNRTLQGFFSQRAKSMQFAESYAWWDSRWIHYDMWWTQDELNLWVEPIHLFQRWNFWYLTKNFHSLWHNVDHFKNNGGNQ